MIEVTFHRAPDAGIWTATRRWLSDRARVPATSWRIAFAAWRRERDLAAIERALGRLSDRRLALLGLDRANLRDAAEAMAERSAALSAIGRDAIEIIGRAGRQPARLAPPRPGPRTLEAA